MESDGLKDAIGAKYLKMEKSVCFLENSIYIVEVPVREHGKAYYVLVSFRNILQSALWRRTRKTCLRTLKIALFVKISEG